MDKTAFPKKYYNKIKDSTFMEDVESLDTEELKAKIVKCEETIYTIEKEKENDDKLRAAKDLVKDYSAGYNDAAAFEKAKVKYCLFILESRGQEVK